MKGKRLLILGTAVALAISGCASVNVVKMNPLKVADSNPTWSSGTPSFGSSYASGTSAMNGVNWFVSCAGNNTMLGWNTSTQGGNNNASSAPLSSIAETTKYGAYQTSGGWAAEKIVVSLTNSDSVTGKWYIWYSTNNGSSWTQATTGDLTSSTTTISYDHNSSIGDSVRFGFGFGTTKTTKTRITLNNIQVYLESSNPVVTYQVTYNGNGSTSGNVPTDDTKYESGDTVIVLGNTENLAKDGYVFAGWNTKADGTGDDYDEDDTFDISENTTLYAQWEEISDGSLKFDLTSNPGEWPTSNPDTLTNYIYTLDNVAYTFALKNVKQNSGYLMMTATAVLGLPALSGQRLSKVVAYNSSTCSTSTVVGISSSSSNANYVSGGETQTWSTTNSVYTYTLPNTDENTMYYLYVTSKNAQLASLKLYYETAAAFSLDHVKITTPATKTVFNVYDTFDCTGLVLTGYDGSNEATANTKEYSNGYTTNYDGHKFTLEEVGNHTVTVTCNGKQDTYQISVATPTPATVSQALTAISELSNNASTDECYSVTGLITDITTSWNDQNGYLTFKMGDSFSDTNLLTAYKAVIDESISDGSQLKVGDQVKVAGKLVKFVNNSGTQTPEIAQGCVVTLLQSASDPDTLTVAEALDIIDDLEDNAFAPNPYAVVGLIAEITTAWDNTYKNITFKLVDSLTDSDKLTAYRAITDENTDGSQLKVGDQVKVVGKLEKFVNNSGVVTPEIPAGGLTSLLQSAGSYTVTFVTNGGSAVASQTISTIGTPKATRPNDPTKDGCDFAGWYSDEELNTLYDFDSVLNDDLVLYAKWVNHVDPAITLNGSFVKVTSADDLVYGGKYLIVYTNDSNQCVAFNGSLSTLDAASNIINLTLDDKSNVAKDSNNANAFFTITDAGNGKSYIQSASGKYIGRSANSNGFDSATATSDAYKNTISFVDGNVVITASGGTTLRYNKASDQKRFRFYKSGQEDIQLYKFVPTFEEYLSSATAIKTIRGNAVVENGQVTSVESVTLRFGVKIPAENWNAIINLGYTISQYGIKMFLTNNLDGVATVESRGDGVASVSASVTPDLDGQGNYNFMAAVNIPDNSTDWPKNFGYNSYFCVRPYVVIDGVTYYLLDEDMHESINTLATSNSGTNLSKAALDFLAQ